MMKVFITDTSGSTDRLAGTDLERAPSDGLMQVWIASSVLTATLTAVVGGENIVRNQALPKRTDGMPNVSDDPPQVSVPVVSGQKVVLNIGGTVGTYNTLAVFTPMEEL